jgi:hypothetical protein
MAMSCAVAMAAVARNATAAGPTTRIRCVSPLSDGNVSRAHHFSLNETQQVFHTLTMPLVAYSW